MAGMEIGGIKSNLPEQGGLVFGEIKNKVFSIKKVTTLKSIRESNKSVTFSLQPSVLKDDFVIGFWHWHNKSTIPSVQDLITFSKIKKLKNGKVIFFIVNKNKVTAFEIGLPFFLNFVNKKRVRCFPITVFENTSIEIINQFKKYIL